MVDTAGHRDARNDGQGDGTRERLLRAAGEVFAEKGFRRATVREICRKAGSNVAAVNYHFRDKEQLYAEVLTYAHRYAMEVHPPMPELPPGATAEDRLRAFVGSFLRRIFDAGRPAWHGKLMAREMTEPSTALAGVVENSVRPIYRALLAIVSDLLGPDAPTQVARLCASSVVGQCLHYFHARPVLKLLNPDLTYGPDAIERWAAHITEFSLGGIRRVQERLGGGA